MKPGLAHESPWGAQSANKPPSNIKVGDIIQADLVPLAHRVGKLAEKFQPTPSILIGYEFRGANGESFVMADALAGRAICIVSGRYRVKGQPAPQHDLEELISESNTTFASFHQDKLVEQLHADAQPV